MADMTRRGITAAAVAAGATLLVGNKATAAQPSKEDEQKHSETKTKMRTATRKWVHFAGFASLNDVANFANASPAQVAGEVVVIPVLGKFDALLFL